jgi:FkbM family methyltransferase
LGSMEIERNIEHLVRVSINAGLCLQELHTSKADLSGSGWPRPYAPHSGTKRSLHRRLGRELVRPFRRLAVPFLNGLNLRIRGAMDHSEIAASLHRIEERLDTMTKAEASVRSRSDTLSSRFESESVDPRLSTVRLSASAISGALAEGLDAARDRLELSLEIARKLETRSDLLVQFTELLLQRNFIALGREFAVRTDAGYLLVPTEDLGLLLSVVETRGRLEPGTLAILLALLPEKGSFVDVGAGIGTFTLPAARRVGPCGRVLSLEPAPRIAALLRRTAQLNNLAASVEIHECAAGDVEQTTRFALSAQTTRNSLWPPNDTMETIDIAVRPLDALIPPGTPVDVIKIDVEGAELQVWRGMQRIVSDNPELVAVLEFGPEHLRRVGLTIAEWFGELTASGYTAWEIDEAAGSLRPLRSTGLQDVYSLNILLMRGSPASRRIPIA